MHKVNRILQEAQQTGSGYSQLNSSHNPRKNNNPKKSLLLDVSEAVQEKKYKMNDDYKP